MRTHLFFETDAGARVPLEVELARFDVEEPERHWRVRPARELPLGQYGPSNGRKGTYLPGRTAPGAGEQSGGKYLHLSRPRFSRDPVLRQSGRRDYDSAVRRASVPSLQSHEQRRGPLRGPDREGGAARPPEARTGPRGRAGRLRPVGCGLQLLTARVAALRRRGLLDAASRAPARPLHLSNPGRRRSASRRVRPAAPAGHRFRLHHFGPSTPRRAHSSRSRLSKRTSTRACPSSSRTSRGSTSRWKG